MVTVSGLSRDISAEIGIRHCEVGVRTGELWLGGDLEGGLLWDRIDDRPFLCCRVTSPDYVLSRLRRLDQAAAAFEHLLWPDPTDNQCVGFLLLR
jgi:hypothetical protein